ncbi:DNA polymerase III subunit gamma/tau [Alcanivorax sp. 1008]|uniref:DNA polymerase III subunit gamma/tau n=1 Tax=Alcanivorax sp. 1008 TaxID=2816853 RepID=UPI001DFC2B2C|nr:DNA polymerase III subunit gamma/tau [Alcanivorax sp. 1008]MCC1495698.1 DNA polymerase III subunit gamma/tau [Alcanivorax sp. 1008]
MSYQVLARKYRPRTFHELVGQEHVSRALVNALDHDRLHHAYLFTGTRGVGKTTIARILSRCLNCEQGVSSQPCGVCDTCVEINEGRFVDLIEVDAASRTKVEDTRELLDNVQYAPTRGRYKVYLIDEVHMLSAHSFNALLKTLEEPPPHVKFLLATTDPQKLPVTILSRCLQFNLKALAADRIAAHLQDLLQREMIGFEAPALALIGQAARGSMRDALSLTDQAIAFSGNPLTEAAVRSMLGSVDRAHVLALLESLAEGGAEQVLAALDQVAEQAPDELALLDELISGLHALAVSQAVPGRQADERITALASRFTAEQVQLGYDIALRGRRDLADAPNPRAGLEMVLLRMVLFRPDGVVPAGGGGGTKKPVESGRSELRAVPAQPALQAQPQQQSSPQQAAKPELAAVPAPATRQGETDGAVWWAKLVAGLPIEGMLRSLAEHAALGERDGLNWTLVLEPGHQTLATAERLEQLSAVISQTLGNRVRLQADWQGSVSQTPAQQIAAARQAKLVKTRQLISQDPVVVALVREFGGQLDMDSIQPDEPTAI